jgi:hypothetical protein
VAERLVRHPLNINNGESTVGKLRFIEAFGIVPDLLD